MLMFYLPIIILEAMLGVREGDLFLPRTEHQDEGHASATEKASR